MSHADEPLIDSSAVPQCMRYVLRGGCGVDTPVLLPSLARELVDDIA